MTVTVVINKDKTNQVPLGTVACGNVVEYECGCIAIRNEMVATRLKAGGGHTCTGPGHFTKKSGMPVIDHGPFRADVPLTEQVKAKEPELVTIVEIPCGNLCQTDCGAIFLSEKYGGYNQTSCIVGSNAYSAGQIFLQGNNDSRGILFRDLGRAKLATD